MTQTLQLAGVVVYKANTAFIYTNKAYNSYVERI